MTLGRYDYDWQWYPGWWAPEPYFYSPKPRDYIQDYSGWFTTNTTTSKEYVGKHRKPEPETKPTTYVGDPPGSISSGVYTYPKKYPPEGYELVPGKCPNEGSACNCPGFCKSTLRKIENK